MRAALKLHAVLVVGSSGGLGHLQSLEQPLLRPVRQYLGAALNSTRWCSPGERKAGVASIVSDVVQLLYWVHSSCVLCDHAFYSVLEFRTIFRLWRSALFYTAAASATLQRRNSALDRCRSVRIRAILPLALRSIWFAQISREQFRMILASEGAIKKIKC